jgi:hypothetical protein
LPYVLLAVLLVLSAGCKSQRELSLMGLWGGEFVLESPSTTGIKPFKGYLRMFGNEKYTLHLDNSSQNFDVTGKWKIADHRLNLEVADVAIHNPSELDQQTLNLKVIPATDIKTTFGREFFLKLGDGDTSLTGLSTSLGPLVGHERFTKRHLDQ